MSLRAAFFLFGFATFLIEVFWLKQNIIAFGSTSQSTGLLLCAYFLGTAWGNFHWGRRTGFRISAPALLGLIMVAALGSFFIYFLIDGHPWLTRQLPVKYGLILIGTFPLSFLMGSVFPLTAKRFFGNALTELYGLNAAGSLFGVMAGSLFLPPLLGYRGLFILGIVLLMAAFLLLFHAFKSVVSEKTEIAGKRLAPGMYGISFFSGFLTLLLEVVFLRQVSIGTDNTIYAFGSVTIILLVLMFCASLVIARLSDRLTNSVFLLPGLLVLSGLGLILSASLFLQITGGLKTVLMNRTLGAGEGFLFATRFIPVGLLFPVAVFPLLIRGLGGGDGVAAGRFFSVNALGSALGAAAGGFVFPGLLGLWGTLFFCAVTYMLLPLFVFRRSVLVFIFLSLLVAAVFNPLRNPLVTPDALSADMPAPATLLNAQEGNYGIVSVVDFGGDRTLWLNSSYMLGSSRSTENDRRLGLFPLMLNPKAEAALVIGLATGITASGLLNSNLKSIACVELVPEVRDAAASFYSGENRNVLSDPRVTTIIGDGRSFVKTTPDHYDIILSDLFIPWHEGTGALYSLEHFKAVREKLNEGGLFLLWLPAYELTEEELCVIARTFCEVFPCVTLWRNTFSARGPVLGLVGALQPLSYAEIAASVRTRSVQPDRDPVEKDPAGILVRLIGLFIKEEELLKGYPLNTLDKPVLEFMAAQKERQFLVQDNYIGFVKRMMGKDVLAGNPCLAGFPTVTEQYRLAGFYMVNSIYYLLREDRSEAYRYFDLYKGLTPEVIH